MRNTKRVGISINIACEQPLLGVDGRGEKSNDSVCIFVLLFLFFFSCSLVALVTSLLQFLRPLK